MDDWKIEEGTGLTHMFENPIDTIKAWTPYEVAKALTAIDQIQSNGLYAVGYISYDAWRGMDGSPETVSAPHEIPLVWLGVYDSVQEFDRRDAGLEFAESPELIKNLHLGISEREYLDSIERTSEYIAAGDVYQVNYTCKLHFENAGSAVGLFARLRKAHPVCYSTFLNAGNFQLISLSPELFLERIGGNITTRPMKGTLHRGRYWEEDCRLAEALQSSEKNRAENLMIVDLMRNDLGRFCTYGDVAASNLFRIERYRSVFQMTGEVKGRIRKGTKSSDILRNTFPPGSVTGAPKIRALEIIDEVERESRGVYCGCIGEFHPGGDLLLNVAIRTILQRGSSCEMGIGGGIVADSEPRLELAEARLKGAFLMRQSEEFDLLETMLFRMGQGIHLLEEHIERMRRSATYFGYRFDEDGVRSALRTAELEIANRRNAGTSFRVRLLASETGEMRIQWTPLDHGPSGPARLLLAERRTDSNIVFCYHKTTNRRALDSDFADARELGFHDVFYLNERGELTETATGNLFLCIAGKWVTPSIECGLLPGLCRAEILSRGVVCEEQLSLHDLASAEAMAVGNSVRGLIGVESVCLPEDRIVQFTRSDILPCL